MCYSAAKKGEGAMFARMKQKKFEDPSKARKEADKVPQARSQRIGGVLVLYSYEGKPEH